MTLSGTEVPGSVGGKGISSEKGGIPIDKGTPRTIQASYLKEMKTIAGCYSNTANKADMRQADSRIHMLSPPPLSQYEVVQQQAGVARGWSQPTWVTASLPREKLSCLGQIP